MNIFLGLIIPFKANAASLEKFKTLGLTEALKEEGIELKNKDYKETKDQAIIYMFRRLRGRFVESESAPFFL